MAYYKTIKKGNKMGSTFEVVERVGTSNISSSDAIKAVVLQASEEKTVSWFKVLEERGRITSDGEIEFQVKVNIGRKL